MYFLNLSTPYDLKSIMHYPSGIFAKPDTFTLESKMEPKEIKKNTEISNIDALEIRLLYNCPKPEQKNEESYEIQNGIRKKSCFFSHINLIFLILLSHSSLN